MQLIYGCLTSEQPGNDDSNYRCRTLHCFGKTNCHIIQGNQSKHDGAQSAKEIENITIYM